VFYFQQLLNIALSGIDATGILPTVINIAYGILLVGFLIGLYQAVLRGGDVQALGITAIKYLVIALIIANWSSAFREVNSSFNSVAQFIGNSSGAGDMFLSWMDQIGQQITNSDVSLLDMITGDIAALIGALLIAVAYVVYAIAIIFFCFFYSLYGSVLYVLGPLVLALLPMAGVGQLAKSFATNLIIWNAWGIIYATMGALITAIQMNQVSQIGTGGFVGFLKGPLSSTILGLVSIFFALSIALIPFIAKRLVSGDVGSTAMAMVDAALTTGGIAVALGAGGAALGATAAASSGSGGGAGNSGGALASAGGGAASSSAPAGPATAGESIRAGIASAVTSGASPVSPSGSGGNGNSDENAGGSSSERSGESGGDRSAKSGGPSIAYRPRGVAQTLAYQAGRAIARAGKNVTTGD
jgi:hypothetical protein